MKTNSTIIIAPLDWGLGHTTRCMPIANYLSGLGCKVVFAASGNACDFLKNDYPEYSIEPVEGYDVSYSGANSASVSIIKQIPKIFRKIGKEKLICKALVEKYNPILIISDNRYGFYHPDVCSVFMTHQLRIQTPKFFKIFEPLLEKIIGTAAKKFDYCWIPDLKEDDSLAGKLSHPSKMPGNHEYIGLLSRFQGLPKFENCKYDVCCLVSGPNPHRLHFRNELIDFFSRLNLKTVIVSGEPERLNFNESDNVTVYSHLNTQDLNTVLNQSSLIVCRSGYSSLMDLALFNKKVICIPTPGQTEQEYLAKWLSEQLKITALPSVDYLSEEIVYKVLNDNDRLLSFPQESYVHFEHVVERALKSRS